MIAGYFLVKGCGISLRSINDTIPQSALLTAPFTKGSLGVFLVTTRRIDPPHPTFSTLRSRKAHLPLKGKAYIRPADYQREPLVAGSSKAERQFIIHYPNRIGKDDC